MQTLITIADLDQPAEVKQPFIDQALKLSTLYGAWKAQDQGGYKYTVNIPGSKTRAPGVHASELGCLLRMVYSLLDVERRPTSEDNVTNMKMRFGVGHALHAMLQNEFKLMCSWLIGNISFKDEVGIHPGLGGASLQYKLYSSCDGEFTFCLDDGTPYLRVGLEIKTASEKEFDKLTKPKAEHEYQTCLYMKALDLPLMWTIYYNKSNSNYTSSLPPYLFQFNNSLWSGKLEPRINSAHQYAQANQLPPREEGFHCRWCPFAWTCNPATLKRAKNYGPSSKIDRPGAIRV